MQTKKQIININQASSAEFPSGVILDCSFLDLLPDMCFFVSDKGIIIKVNRQTELLLGRPENLLLNNTFAELLRESDQQIYFNALQSIERSDSSKLCEVQFINGFGNQIDCQLFISRYIFNTALDKQYYFIIAKDISEEKRKELDLLRFSNLAHYTVNPLEITDVEGRLIYVNPAFEKACGYTKEELIGKNPRIFGSNKHPKSFWQKMWQTISSGKVWVGEIENKRRNGEAFYTQLLVSPIVNSEGNVVGYFGIHRDITEQRQLEQHLIHAQKMESIGMLVAGIAHEVGNPLTSISSLVQIIQRSTVDEFINDKLELIKSQITRISRIIRDLVDYSRRSNYEIQLVNVNKALKEAVEIVRVGKKAKDISFHVELDELIPSLPLVYDQIEQVFINILINSIDAINSKMELRKSQKQVIEKGEISVINIVNADKAIILIRDNGIGIPGSRLPKIFEPFFTTKKVGEGTGLGLWVSYGIVKSFQGDIKVESAEGAWTEFKITLPIYSEK